jgi:hypothetical protein
MYLFIHSFTYIYVYVIIIYELSFCMQAWVKEVMHGYNYVLKFMYCDGVHISYLVSRMVYLVAFMHLSLYTCMKVRKILLSQKLT